VYISWDAALPAPPNCAHTFVAVDVLALNGPHAGTITKLSSTGSQSGSTCKGAAVTFNVPQNFLDYRFVITARPSDSSSAPTKAFTFQILDI
jgi:hypothetical protein